MIFHVENYTEALEKILSFKNDGIYDWFRGQIKPWRLVPSFLRINTKEREQVQQVFGRFEKWVEKTPGLEYLIGNTDAQVAIAQHYGIPTNFIDFTTDPRVAAFFAIDHKDDVDDACILCLNCNDLKHFIENLPERYQQIEFIQIDVSNLWRLQAQAGSFLFCPYTDYELIYDFDRVLFKYHPGDVDISCMRKEFYPDAESPLEVLLHQFVDGDVDFQRYLSLKRMAENGLIRLIKVNSFSEINCDLLKNKTLPPIHPTWKPENIEAWISHQDLPYTEIKKGVKLHFQCDESEELQDIRNSFMAFVRNQIKSDPHLREKACKWSVTIDNQNIGWIIQPLWDGARGLPFNNSDLAEGLGLLASATIAHLENNTVSVSNIFKDLLDDVIKINFGAKNGGDNFAFPSREHLRDAVRTDIMDFIDDTDRIDDIHYLLQALYSPRYLFDFDKLTSLWIREIIPAELLISKGEKAVFYSPARIDSLGPP